MAVYMNLRAREAVVRRKIIPIFSLHYPLLLVWDLRTVNELSRFVDVLAGCDYAQPAKTSKCVCSEVDGCFTR